MERNDIVSIYPNIVLKELQEVRAKYAKLTDLEVIDYKSAKENERDVVYLRARNKRGGFIDSKVFYSNQLFKKSVVNPATELALALPLKMGPDLKILYFDIETDDRSGKPEIGKARVVSVASFDDTEKMTFICEDDEALLLRKTKEMFANYDLLLGWYSESFDFPVLLARGKIHGVSFEAEIYKHADFLKLLDKLHNIRVVMSSAELPDFTLGTLGKHFLNLPKEELDRSGAYGGQIYGLFVRDREKLKNYNVRDCVILKGLEEKFKIIAAFTFISNYVHIPLHVLRNSISPAVEAIILKTILEKSETKEELAEYVKKLTRFSDDEKEIPYKGAYIYLSNPGLYSNVIILDFVSLYPNLMRTFNVSFDTVLDSPSQNSIKVGEAYFDMSRKGILAEISDKLFAERVKFKNLKMATYETAVKLLNNSSYGYFGSKFSQFKNIKVAESITFLARFLMSSLVEHYSTTSTPIVYVHTDGLSMVNVSVEQIPEKLKEVNAYVRKLVQDEFKILPEKNYLELKFEKHFKKFLIEKKGRYVGRVDIEESEKVADKLYFRGIELARGDFNIFSKELVVDLMARIFDEISANQIKEFLLLRKKPLINKEIPLEKMAFTTKIGKMMDEYTTVPIHAKVAAREAEERGHRYFVSQRVSYILTGRDKKGLKAVSLEEAIEKEIPYDAEVNWRRIWLVVQRFLELAFPEEDFSDIETGSKIVKQCKLGEYSR